MPDGQGVKWVFPKTTQGDVDVLIDLLDVHPLPITGILMTWAPGFVPPTALVSFSPDNETYTAAKLPDLANFAPPKGAPSIVAASFNESGEGVPVRYVKITFPKGVFERRAVLREISFQYRRGPSDDAPEDTKTQIVDVDIEPKACPNEWNVKANTPLAVAILGRPGVDVRRIDAASVELEGIRPISWTYADVGAPILSDVEQTECTCAPAGPDGVVDLVLHYKGAGIRKVLGPIADQDVRVLELKGEVGQHPSDHIKGRDCLVVKVPGKGMRQ